MSGVSVTWYTWLEQGRDVHASAGVLERISDTFRLNHDERSYLFSLVQHRPPPFVPDPSAAVSPVLERMVHSLGIPALVKTVRWDVVAWNSLVATIFRDYGKLALPERNLLRILITDPRYREDPDEYEAMVRRILAKLRIDYSEAGQDPAFAALIAELEAASPVFKRVWREPEVTLSSNGVNRTRHATLGELAFEHSSYVPEGNPFLRVVLFIPYDKVTERTLVKLRNARGARKSG
jgi:transcriptional regulator with XRE-family HTH domain